MTATRSVLAPHSPEAEISVLGACLQDLAAAKIATRLLTPSDFHLDNHREIFGVIETLVARKDTPDLVTAYQELIHRGKAEQIGAAYLEELVAKTPTSANIASHARIVQEESRRRRLLGACTRIASKVQQNGASLDVLLAQLQDDIAEVSAAGRDTMDHSTGVDAFQAAPPELAYDIEGVRVHGDHGWTSAAPKSMKGLLSLEEARANATGTPFLGHFAARKCRVLYGSEEDRVARLHRRVNAMLAGRPPEEIPGPDDLRFLIKAGCRLDTPEGLEILRRHIALWSPEIVFLEHFDRLHSKRPNQTEDMKPLLDELDAMHAEFGCAFRVQKHTRKEAMGQSKRKGEMIAGSISLFGWGESSVYLTLIRRGVAQVEVEAKDGDMAPRFLVVFKDGKLTYGGEVKADRKEQAREDVLEFLAKTPGATREDVAAALKISGRTVGSRLRESERDGLVVGKSESSRQPKQWWLKDAETQPELVGK